MNWHTLYPMALFTHIVGVLGLFIAMGLQWTVLHRLRHAETVAQLRAWLGLLAVNRRLSLPSTVVIVSAGVYMWLTAWSWRTPWILVSLGAIVIMMALGIGIATRRLKAAGEVAESATDLSPELRGRINDPLAWIATQVGGATALGVVFLMTIKPGLGGSLLTLVAAMAIGGAVGFLTSRQRLRPEPSAAHGAVIEEVSVR